MPLLSFIMTLDYFGFYFSENVSFMYSKDLARVQLLSQYNTPTSTFICIRSPPLLVEYFIENSQF